MSVERPTIVVQDVLGMLEQGKTREEVRQHYQLNKTDLKRLFKHPKLKGKKSHKKFDFLIVDEEAENDAQRVLDSKNLSPVTDAAPAQDTQENAPRDFRNPETHASMEEDELSGRETFGNGASV